MLGKTLGALAGISAVFAGAVMPEVNDRPAPPLEPLIVLCVQQPQVGVNLECRGIGGEPVRIIVPDDFAPATAESETTEEG